MVDRRRERRYVVSFPVVVESQSRYSFVSRTRDAGRKGLAVLTAAKLEVGEPVCIAYRGKGRSEEHEVEGHIVRIETNEGEGKADWPYLAAIELSGPLPDIDDLVDELTGARPGS